MKKRAQSVSLGKLPMIALLLVLIAMITGAGSLTLDSFKETQCANAGLTWNVTGGQCLNANGAPGGDYAVNATSDGLVSLNNLTDQMPTVGTIIGVVAIIVVVVGGFGVFLRGRGSL